MKGLILISLNGRCIYIVSKNNSFMCTGSKQLFYVVYLTSKIEAIQYI